jgi:hypothetical protein
MNKVDKINELLKRKDLPKDLRKSLEQKKDILEQDKDIKK